METTTKKVTKAEVINTIKANVEAMTFSGDVTAEDVIAYCDTTLAQLAAKTEKSRERAAAKKAEGDELRTRVKEVLTSEYQTREQIYAAVGDSELTVPKVGARLTQLCEAGLCEKDQIKTVDGRKVMGYRVPATE